MKVLLFATFAASTVAFIPTSNKVESNALLAVKEKSGALPFLPYPENLRGYVGEEIGFDPLRISDYFPMDYLREAELKHSRIAMVSWLAVQEMLQGSGREPGNFGFGLKYLDGKSEENIKKVKMWELLNGRLAMFAIGGAATQSVLTGHGFPYV